MRYPTKSALLLLLCFVACSQGDADPAPLDVRIAGSEGLSAGLPAGALEDGWSIEFDRLLLTTTSAETPWESAMRPAAYELVTSSGDGSELATLEINTNSNTLVQIAVGPLNQDSEGGNAGDADLELLRSNGWSLYIEGRATRDAQTKSFAWGFALSEVYQCPVGPDFELEEPPVARVTVRADRLFRTELGVQESLLRFDALAQADDDGDADGTITLEELAGMQLDALSGYDAGDAEVDDLSGFIEALASGLVYVDDERPCPAMTSDEES